MSVLATITEGGGFCCPTAFLASWGIRGQEHIALLDADLIARRIGVHPRTVYKWNAAVRSGKWKPCYRCR